MKEGEDEDNICPWMFTLQRFPPKLLHNQFPQNPDLFKHHYNRPGLTLRVHIHWTFCSSISSRSPPPTRANNQMAPNISQMDVDETRGCRTACNSGLALCGEEKQNKDNISYREHQRQMTAEWSLKLLSTTRVIIFSPLFGISWNEMAQSKVLALQPSVIGKWY